jgi:hypothetical protein
MELNFPGILAMSLIGMLVISLPYLYYMLKFNESDRTVEESRQRSRSTRQLVLSKVQKWRNHYMLGLDANQNVLVYQRYGHYPAEETINLDEVDHTSIDIHYEDVTVGNSKVKKLGYLDILLHFKDGSRPAKSITIYDKGQIPKVADELFIADSWVSTINSQLKTSEEKPMLRLAR